MKNKGLRYVQIYQFHRLLGFLVSFCLTLMLSTHTPLHNFLLCSTPLSGWCLRWPHVSPRGGCFGMVTICCQIEHWTKSEGNSWDISNVNYWQGWLSLVLLSIFFSSNLLFRWMTVTPPAAAAAAAAGLGSWKDEKNLMDWPQQWQPNTLAPVQLSVTQKKLIPFEVIKSIPINDILFNYLTLRGPNLTLRRNKLWSKGWRWWAPCASLKLCIDFCSKCMQLINEWEWTKDGGKNSGVMKINVNCSVWLLEVKRDRKCVSPELEYRICA